MKIYLIMYQAHERSGYMPTMAFKDKTNADNALAMEQIGAATTQPAFTIQEIEVKDW